METNCEKSKMIVQHQRSLWKVYDPFCFLSDAGLVKKAVLVVTLVFAFSISESSFANYAEASTFFQKKDYVRAAGSFFQSYSYPKSPAEKMKAEWGLAESLRLYYGKFEFNGSFYLLLRSIGQMILSYNPIAVLSKIMIVLALSGMIWVYYRKLELLTGIFWLLAIYLVFSAVVHPWYLTPLVAFSAFIRFRFALLWSALIPLSYYTYSNNPYNENYWITGIEYLIVYGFLIWELKKQVSPLAEMK